ncbi:hypothetical protein KGQ90_03605 [Modicisalibacter tunisiensis]|uniref:hypothetical protein n=1 Tax=Modicisalibacter tunisiensis TaxID=390637 RepID=UPI001CCD7562|nr:hypothetical protein [Modicisalibacter tunisiensis]MBZ9538029.1 hypothetical protein [Modicisalibacter tunisiensis]
MLVIAGTSLPARAQPSPGQGVPPDRQRAIAQALATLPAEADALDAWLQVEALTEPDWSYTFVQGTQANSSMPSAPRLIAELDAVATLARARSRTSLAAGLHRWQAQLDALTASRLPGRAEPAWLMTHPRHVPRIAGLSGLGWCRVPDWVEAWTPAGVARLAWHPGMNTDRLMAALPAASTRYLDRAHVVTPLGEILPLGVAAWNHESLPLAPGSRVVFLLPVETPSAAWLDSAMPRFLSTRLPGDDCVTFPLGSAAAHD